jgi:hypothetical protein
MELINKDTDGEIWFHLLEHPYPFSTPFNGETYVCLLVVNDQNISADEQFDLSATLVASGCRYVCSMGHDSSSWDTSVDTAYLETDPNYNPSDDQFVMTTWHDDEPLEDTINFFLNFTHFDDNIFTKWLILFLGSDEDKKEEMKDLIAANKREQSEYLERQNNGV